MIILVCGGRTFYDEALVARYLDPFLQQVSIVIQGGARGADHLSKRWATRNRIHTAQVDSLWDVFGNPAGGLRNSAMLVLRPDICVAFPGNTGTADMVRKCLAAGVLVIEAEASA